MINPAQRAWSPIAPPSLDWRENTPVSIESQDIYFSTTDGLAESEYIFLHGNRLIERWQNQSSNQPFVVAELGLGTGLNAAMTITRWLSFKKPKQILHYIALEREPLGLNQIQRALSRWPELKPVVDRLLCRWPDPLPGCHRRTFSDWGLTIDFWWEDAGAVLTDLASHGRRWVNAWYLDGFAPSRQVGPWRTDIYEAMAKISHRSATFATFTSAGNVKRGLQNAGFDVNKRPGFAEKRDALIGHFRTSSAERAFLTPWDLNPYPATFDSAVVVGAGLAGAHMAHALACRGIAVTLLEAGSCAGQGSSNLQGITYTRLSHLHNPLTDFSNSSFSHAVDFYQSMAKSGALVDGIDIGLGGYIQLTDRIETLNYMSQVLPRAPDFAKVVDVDEITSMINLTPRCGGIHYLKGGWLNPRALCRALLNHPKIEVREHCGEISLKRTSQSTWIAIDPEKRPLAEAPIATLATAHATQLQDGLEWLPLNVIRGQTTHLEQPEALALMSVALCDQGYLPPARKGIHCMGASYDVGDMELAMRDADHHHNIEMICKALPDFRIAPPKAGWQGHVALRCNSRDYLPVIGVAPDQKGFNRVYQSLKNDSRKSVDASLPTIPFLSLLTALGSRGLTIGPLGAQVLVDQLLGTPPCIPRYLNRAISPARFLERKLRRQLAT